MRTLSHIWLRRLQAAIMLALLSAMGVSGVLLITYGGAARPF